MELVYRKRMQQLQELKEFHLQAYEKYKNIQRKDEKLDDGHIFPYYLELGQRMVWFSLT